MDTIVRQRLNEFQDARQQFERVLGCEAWAALERFYAVIVELFESGGSAGALSWHSREPEPAAPALPVPTSSTIGMLPLLLLLGMFGLVAVRRQV